MIVGRGLLRNSLISIDCDEYLFYVNGISNSVIKEIPANNFESIELQSIALNIPGKTLVYFSTIQVNVQENHLRPYVQHKIKIEELIKEIFPHYLIVRTSNLVGNNPWNTNTLFNFLYHSLSADVPVTVVESAVRNILDVDHFIQLLQYCLERYKIKNTTCNIVNPRSFTMDEVLAAFEQTLSKKFIKNHSPVNIAYFEAPCEFSLSLVKKCGISLENYLPRVIKKYYLRMPKTITS